MGVRWKFYLCLLTPAAGLGYISTVTPSLSSSVLGLTAADTIGPPQYIYQSLKRRFAKISQSRLLLVESTPTSEIGMPTQIDRWVA